MMDSSYHINNLTLLFRGKRKDLELRGQWGDHDRAIMGNVKFVKEPLTESYTTCLKIHFPLSISLGDVRGQD